MKLRIVDGDLLDQDGEVIVNAWNRNIIPWWLLLPQGVSGAIKKRAGLGPFRELGRHGAIALGGAVLTGAGELPHRGIIHVAGISMAWRSSERSIRASVRSAMATATVAGQGMASASDVELIDCCRAEGRCLVTLDLDFSNPMCFPPSPHHGIAVLRLPARFEAGHPR
ncbi:MAG: DUF5615 family PIN-like protein [Deltaproteobacteria bacterium]|jgi:O-acetyl-ADP-ribose deacetylase (regulator of RNase III)|nr:DUF5615 family PIN-like protein [Deltaproteobacteria bacterium]MBW2532186.1 DUF5615 family PIN-like protein [Deltaproteobacteria bacterium]